MQRFVNLILWASVLLGLFSCSKKEQDSEVQKWEYKTLSILGERGSDFYQRYIDLPEAELDTLGAQGWELVSVYTQVETVHPNFGDPKYVTGLQPNTRTTGVFYVFKRPITKKSKSKKENTEGVEVEVPVDSVMMEAPVPEN